MKVYESIVEFNHDGEPNLFTLKYRSGRKDGGRVVHYLTLSAETVCGSVVCATGVKHGGGMYFTDENVTCQRCLKWAESQDLKLRER